MSGRPVGRGIRLVAIFAVAVAAGVFLRRWKGNAFRSNILMNVVAWVGTAIGYFLVADRSGEHTQRE